MTVIIETPRQKAIDLLSWTGWIKGQWGDNNVGYCLHGAIRACCSIPGDAFLIEQVATLRGRGQGWNDARDRTFGDVKRSLLFEDLWSLREQDLIDTFGENWWDIVKLVRRCATITKKEAEELANIFDGGVAAIAAIDAAKAARSGGGRPWVAAKAAAKAAAARAARSGGARPWVVGETAGAAGNAAIGLACRGLPGFTYQDFDDLMKQWVTVFGAEGATA